MSSSVPLSTLPVVPLPQNPSGDEGNNASLVAQKRALEDEVARLRGVIDERERILQRTAIDLQRKNDEINEELEIAKSVQAGLLPKAFPEFINLQAAAVYMPTGKVGGDLYDIIVTPHQKIAALIFDVSGHGVPAALIGATAKMLFAQFIEKIESPAIIFSEVNRRLCSYINTEHYLTAFLGILDPIHNTMVYSRAGHVRPLIYRCGSGAVEKLGGRGFFIGHNAIADMAEYTQETIEFEPGDKMLMYTDGLTEATNAGGEFFGGQRLFDSFQKNGGMEIHDCINTILEQHTRFRGGEELRDDFTLLCMQVDSADWILRESGFTREEQPHMLMASTYTDIDRVSSLILRAMDQQGFPDSDIKHVKICVFEMLMNAIEHGNRRDTRKRAIVLYAVNSGHTRVSVMDEGDGFDCSHIPNPRMPENLLKDFGRGLFIIHEYMDTVSFNAKGNRIAVQKNNSGRKDV